MLIVKTSTWQHLGAPIGRLTGGSLPKSNMPVRAAAYARVSTLGQVKEDPWASLPRQIDDMRLLAARNNMTIVFEVEEQGSGAKGDRPGWLKVMDAVRDKSIDVILCVAFDRLTRSERIGDFEDLKRDLRIFGVRLLTVRQGEIDLSGTADAETRSDFDAVLAKRERLVIRERTMAGRKAKGQSGGYTGHHPPFGYATHFDIDTGKKTFPVSEEQALVVRKMFADFAAGVKLGELARGLNASGATAPGRRGRGAKLWYAATIRDMLSQPSYMGLSAWHRGREAAVPSTDFIPIVESEVWEAVQRELAVLAVRGPRGSHSPRPLSGILRCRACGTGMGYQRVYQNRRDNDHYVCRKLDKQKTLNPCEEPQILNDVKAEAAILDYLRTRLPAYLGDDLLSVHASRAKKKAQADPTLALVAKIAQAKGRQSRVLDLLLDEEKGDLSVELEAKLGDLRIHIKGLEAELIEARQTQAKANAVRSNTKEMRGVAEIIAKGIAAPEHLRGLFDAALLQVVLVKTSKPYFRQVLEVERCQLRNGDWL
jgi:site-specific DNA recombinase